MSEDAAKPGGPDLAQGLPLADLPDGGMLQGHVGEDAVLLARRGGEVFAIGAFCTHYHGPLAEGLMVGDTVRCPWHHACFSLRTGEALRAPALDPAGSWRVERQGDRIFVREKAKPAPRPPTPGEARGWPASILIVGGGAAGLAAAEMLRRQGYDRPVTVLSADDSPPCDRPNLSKDYLAGTVPEEWIPLRSPKFYERRRIELRLETPVAAIDPQQKRVRLADGSALEYGALLLATGAAPIRLAVPGADAPHVHYLRTLADSRAIVGATAGAKCAVVVGASFIGLEVAASLRKRQIEVHVVAPEARPMERVLGAALGDFIRALHESQGVAFHLGETVKAISGRAVQLSGGSSIEADFVVVGIGVRPATGLAEAAGLAVDKGVLVDEHLETSAPGIFAAGDIARWPDAHSGERIRIEHWVVAERQGQIAARNMLGQRERFDAAPFFWSQHYDVVISCVGHAARWDAIEVEGSIEARDCVLTYRHDGKRLAVASIFRDQDSLRAEVEMEREIAAPG